jgi:protein-S-isoprenylcysteine O-methyltransferase Ste14
MLAKRSSVRDETKGYDHFLAPTVVFIGSFVINVIAELDERFGWCSPIALGWWVFSILLAFASQTFVLQPMVSNPFLSTTLRIKAERGHQLTDYGPYRLVRHSVATG